MSARTVLVLGGGIAGHAAALRAREIDSNARIIVLDTQHHVRLPPRGLATLLAAESRAAARQTEPDQALHGELAIEVRGGAEVVAIFPHRHAVTARHEGREQVLAYDTLVYALGARTRTPPWRAANLVTLDGWADVDTLERIESAGGRRAVVLGDDAHAIEAATGLARADFAVTLVTERDRLLVGYDPEYGELARRGLVLEGVKVLLGTAVTDAEVDDGRVRRLVLSGDRTVDVDIVVASQGREPRTELLPASAVSSDGTVRIDLQARTTLSDVFAAGACVSTPRTVTGEHVWLPLPALGDRVGQVAGANAAGGDARMAPAVGGEYVQAGRMLIGRVGLSRAEGVAYTPDLRSSTTHAPPHETWMPGADPITLTLLWDGRDGRVLGAEGAGIRGLDKRLDAVSVAVAAGLPVWTLASIDLGYAAGLSRVRDAVSVVATIATQDRLGRARSTREIRHGALLLDVGPAGAPRMPGALRVPVESLREQLSSLERTRPVVTICPDGRRSALAAEVLVHAGFSDVRYLEGGLWNWELQGRTVERG